LNIFFPPSIFLNAQLPLLYNTMGHIKILCSLILVFILKNVTLIAFLKPGNTYLLLLLCHLFPTVGYF
jgi:hypothetical protein